VVQRRMRDNRVLAVGLIALAVVAGSTVGRPGLAATPVTGGSCDSVAKAYQLPGAYGVTPAAWSGDGLTVPACGPIPDYGGATTPVYPYPGALRTPGYQCVEFSERYLFYRYGVTMGISTDGDQVAAHYAAAYPARFMVVRNGTPRRAPVAGDVLSMSTVPGFDSTGGGHTAVVQASAVDANGDGSVTIVEQNAVPSGVQVLTVTDWAVRYDEFPYLEWLTAAGSPEVFSHDATTGSLRDARWTGTAWTFLTLDGAGSALPGHISDDVGTASSAVEIGGQPTVFYSDATTGSLRVAWRSGGAWQLKTLDGPGSTLAGHTSDHVGAAVSAVVVAGEPQVFYSDTTSGSVRYAWKTAAGWRFETLDGPGSLLAQHTWHHVGSTLSALTADGQPQVYYYDTTAGTMHRAWWNGTRWLFLTIDGATSQLAGHTADRVGSAIAATLSGGQPQLFYADATRRSLRYAELTATGWQFEALDGSGATVAGHTADHVGGAVGVTQMNGDTQVYYYDATRQSLRHAWWTGSVWLFETLDGAGSVIAGHDTDQVGAALSVTTTTTGPQVFYTDASRGSLRHAWWTSSGWHFETLDGPGSTLPGRTAHTIGARVSVTLY